jgi:hypothetical protein
MKCKVTPPYAKDFDINEGFMKPVYTALGDLLCARKGPRFGVSCGTKWFNELEGRAQVFSGRPYTVKERLLTCSFFTLVGYDSRLKDYEVELREDK